VRRVRTLLLLLADRIRRRGVRDTARRLVRLAALYPARRREAREGRAFDARLGIDTEAWVHWPDLDPGIPDRRAAVRYQPSSIAEFKLLMGKLPIDQSDFVFVDYGSGKGRVLFLAAEYPFKRIVGVEFSERLDAIARRNIEVLGTDGRQIETRLMDAAEFEPPLEPLVLYFFNAFGGPVLRQVLERVRASLELRARPVYVVLVGRPELATVVEEAGFAPLFVEALGWGTRGVFAASAS
jgi:SAM-dependent methyltransferase